MGEKYGQARAHGGLAEAYRTSGDSGQARLHWQQALALYTDLGNPEAEQIRARLAAADDADRQPQPADQAGRHGLPR